MFIKGWADRDTKHKNLHKVIAPSLNILCILTGVESVESLPKTYHTSVRSTLNKLNRLFNISSIR